MNKQSMARIVVLASFVSLVVAPVVVAACRAVAGPVHPGSVAIGAIVATLFFAISGAMAVVTWDDDDLQTPILGTYATKIALLAVAGLLLAGTDLNRSAFAVSAVVSAFSYLAIHSFAIMRNSVPNKP